MSVFLIGERNFTQKRKSLVYNTLQVGGRFPVHFLLSFRLEGGFQHTFWLPPSWREVSSTLFGFLRVGGKFPVHFLLSSKLEGGFQHTFWLPPSWREFNVITLRKNLRDFVILTQEESPLVAHFCCYLLRQFAIARVSCVESEPGSANWQSNDKPKCCAPKRNRVAHSKTSFAPRMKCF
jgi:hypothetical protein